MPLGARKFACVLLSTAAVSGSTLSAGAASDDQSHCAAPGPIKTTASVTAASEHGALTLHPAEKVALLFLASITSLEFWCVQEQQRACTLKELTDSDTLSNGYKLGCLKYDPSDDPSYDYSITANGQSWDARAKPKKKGLLSFHFKSTESQYMTLRFYSTAGKSDSLQKELTDFEVGGASFVLP